MKLLVFKLLPKNYISYVFGILARCPVPPFLRDPFYSWYSKRYGVNLSEAKDDISQFSSLSKFFLRELKPGLRAIGKGIVSAADGALTAHGPIENDTIIQAKGISYSVSKLVANEAVAKEFEGGHFVTIYLAPGDYHHVHAPMTGSLREVIHAEGALWPVNNWSVSTVDDLFVINERMTVMLDGEEGTCGVVFVGATNVGAIALEHFPLKGNRLRAPWSRPKVHRLAAENSPQVQRGERLGSFCLGSTIVLLFAPGVFEPGKRCTFGDITLGTPLSGAKK